MICSACKTPILNRDNFLWIIEKDTDSDAAAHDDCVIRFMEFAGESIRAGDIFRDSDILYRKDKSGGIIPILHTMRG